MLEDAMNTLNSLGPVAISRTPEEIRQHKINSLYQKAIDSKKDIDIKNFLCIAHTIRLNSLKRRVELNGSPVVRNSKLYMQFRHLHPEIKFKSEDTKETVLLIAEENEYNPIGDYLNDLSTDVNLVTDQELSQWFGLDPKDDLSLDILWLCLRSAYQRGVKPGSKSDLCPILYGKPGLRKSTGIEALVPTNEWYNTCQNNVDIEHKDFLSSLNSHWFNEFAEIESLLTGKRASDIKGWSTRCIDNYPEKYENLSTSHLRTGVIWGTTNTVSLFSDVTGNRRFGVVRVMNTIDTDSIKNNCNRLWSTIKHQVEVEREITYLEDGCPLDMRIADRNELYNTSNPIQEGIIDFINELKDDKIHSKELLFRLSQIGIVDRGTLTYVLGDLMVKAGFERSKSVRVSGNVSSGWRRVNPKQESPPQTLESQFNDFKF